MSDGRGGNIKWFVGVHLFPNQANGKLVARNPGVLDFLGSPFLEGWNFLGEIPTEGPVVHHSLTRWWQLKYFLFSPPSWGDDPIWPKNFTDGLVQPPTSWHVALVSWWGFFPSIWQPQKFRQRTSQNEQTAKHLGTTKRRWFFGESNIRQYQIYLTPKGSFGRDHPLIFSEI